MSYRFRGSRRELRAALIACVLMAVMLGLATQSASATLTCPAFGNRAGSIAEWETRYEGRGVTLCKGLGSRGETKGWLQMIELHQGARIRFGGWVSVGREVEEPEKEYERGELYTPEVRFRKNTARHWWDLIREMEYLEVRAEQNPDLVEEPREQLFSVTNATFFTRDEDERPTTLPFPFKTLYGQDTFGISWARAHPEPVGFCEGGPESPDADYEAPKKYAVIGRRLPESLEPEEEQFLRISITHEHYECEDTNPFFWASGGSNMDGLDGLISFTQEYRVGESARRNLLGVYLEHVYIFTSDENYTNEVAAEIMYFTQPGIEVIQLDGGGSAQFYSEYGAMDSAIPIIEREVPTFISVYESE